MTESVAQPRAKKRRLKIALATIGAILVVMVGAVGIYAATLSQKFESSETLTEVFPDETLRPAPVEVEEEEAATAQNILLLGSDTRGRISGSLGSASGNRSDTMMVVHMSADRKNIHVMSIMRDSWVTIPGRGEAKMNAALAYGGVPLVVQTVEGLINARIDHVAVVDFTGFQGITDALGGVTVNNAIAFSRKGEHFAQGPLNLNGTQALVFVRERYAFQDGDYQRVRNQQAFIRAVMDKTLTRETLTNPVTISNLVGAIAPYMAIDEGLTSAYAAGLGFELRDIRSDDVTFFTMPTLGTGNVSGQSIVRVDYEQLEIIKEHFRADTLAQYEPKTQTMSGSAAG
jgi:LCP family protein required for cell wall assembly